MEGAKRAQVVLDRVAARLDRPFDYLVPPEFGHIGPGWRVRVPLGRTTATGLVVGWAGADGPGPVTLRPILGPVGEEPLLLPDLVAVVRYLRDQWCCWWGQAVRTSVPAPVRQQAVPPLDHLYAGEASPRGTVRQRLWAFVREHPGAREADARGATGASAAVLTALLASGALWRGPAPQVPSGSTGAGLNPAQAAAVATLRRHLDGGGPSTVLLEGVTGSGKTEVYLAAVDTVLAQGRQAIVLVPEIALTPQMGARFRARFPGRVAVFHSAMADGERVREWYRARRGEADVVLGPRSAVFAPCPRLGLVVLDEEHESTYKQEEHPRYHARDVAAERLAHTGGLLVLGSATPSLETAHAARAGRIGWVRLPERVAGRPLAAVQVVDLRAELQAGNHEMFSRVLAAAVDETLEAGDQVLLLLNRRGFAKSVVCRTCGHTARCPDCSVSLTWHREDQRLRCHYCDYRRDLPQHCPACGSTRLRSFGVGTEQVLEAAAARWPAARMARADRDSLSRRGSHERLFQSFADRQLDMLVGTQLLAKGMDWPHVTLVGIIAADLALSLPDFRAAERTYDLLTQAAGRAGRGAKRGRVVVQTYNPEHYSVAAAASQDFQPFYDQEVGFREELGYPPFGHLLLVEASAASPPEARAPLDRLAAVLRGQPHLTVRGPSPAPVEKVRTQHRCHMLIRATSRDVLLAAAHEVAASDPSLSLTIDPYNFL
ncbi:MAG: primosomal protein N' [Thermaerobacter sp.]|nr:primosomal protein N' [Thermaerobacter sp.]